MIDSRVGSLFEGGQQIRLATALCAVAVAVAACANVQPSPSRSESGVSPSAALGASPTVAARRSVLVPAGIDATGATGTTRALLDFFATVPDHSTIEFPTGAVYRLDGALKFSSRSDLVFEGHGATLMADGGTTEAGAVFWLEAEGTGNHGITIRNFTFVGNSIAPGVYLSGREGAHGVIVDGGQDTEISGVTMRGLWGDCFYVGVWSLNVWIHDSHCETTGRNGVTITAGQGVVVERVAFDVSGYTTFDIEPNESTEGARSVALRDNTVGTWTNSFLSATGAEGSTVDGVTVSGNTVTGATLLTIIDLPRRQNISFVGNVADVAGEGPILTFAHVDGLTILNNRQPLTSGRLADISDSTAVVYE